MSTLQPNVTTSGSLWISAGVLSALCTEANRCVPNETGGVLLGYWSVTPGEPVVTDVIGPGPRAVHQLGRFLPDHDYQEAEIARLYHESDRTLRYLGDWHSHPGASGLLSSKDRRTLRRIAVTRSAQAPRPVMLILAHGPNWEPVAWTLERRQHCVLIHSFGLELRNVEVFAGSHRSLTSD